MDIKKLIDRNCPFLGILEDSKGVYEALKKNPYIVVIDEESVMGLQTNHQQSAYRVE